MRQNKKILVSIFWIVLSAAMIYLQFSHQLDSYWTGLGTALFIVGVTQIARQIRYRFDKKYQENTDIQNSDERNRFLSNKAWAWAGYLYVLLGAVSIIVFQIVGMKDVSHFMSVNVCVLLILYWVSYLVLGKKY